MTSLRDIGEFGFIRRIQEFIRASDRVKLPIGDDCAAIAFGGSTLLVTTDMAVEDVHFRLSTATPYEIGRRAAAAAFSDIAAMGGDAVACLLSIAAPPGFEAGALAEVVRGAYDLAKSCGADLCGGDTTRSRESLVIDVLVLGEARGRYLTRSGARPGDRICVSGWPGCAAAGLHLIEHGLPEIAPLVEAHRRPAPRLELGRLLAAQDGVHAMIDVSDGLGQDTGHIAEMSGLSAHIAAKLIPIAPALAQFANRHNLDAGRFVLSGGEDFELAFAADPGWIDHIKDACRERNLGPIHVIGEFREGSPGVYLDGEHLDRCGYEHFKRG